MTPSFLAGTGSFLSLVERINYAKTAFFLGSETKDSEPRLLKIFRTLNFWQEFGISSL